MKQINCEERHIGLPFFKLTHFAGFIIIALITLMFTSCGDDEDSLKDSDSLVGTWVLEETYEDEDESASIKMTLKFNKDNTGSIVEDWVSQTKSSTHETYSMNFSWSTTSDSNGNDILRVSYVSGDKNTELFPGVSSTVLWTRQFVQTGKILNIYSNDGVWVLNKK